MTEIHVGLLCPKQLLFKGLSYFLEVQIIHSVQAWKSKRQNESSPTKNAGASHEAQLKKNDL